MIKNIKIKNLSEMEEKKKNSLKNSDILIYFEDKNLDTIAKNFAKGFSFSKKIRLVDNSDDLYPKPCPVPVPDIRELVNLYGPIVIFISKAILGGILAGIGKDIYKKIKEKIILIKRSDYPLGKSFSIIFECENFIAVFDFWGYFDQEDIKNALNDIPVFLKRNNDKRFYNQIIFPVFNTKKGKWIY